MGIWASSEVSDAQTMGGQGREEDVAPGGHALPRKDPRREEEGSLGAGDGPAQWVMPEVRVDMRPRGDLSGGVAGEGAVWNARAGGQGQEGVGG